MRRLTFAVLLVLSGPAGAIHAGTAFEDPIYGVSTTSDIVYGTGLIDNGLATLDLLLDLYQPVDIGGGALPAISPGIVFIHGGSWQFGSKTDFYAVDFGNLYASLGYVVTSINYRLLGDNVPVTTGPADLMVLFVPDAALRHTINAGIEDAAKAMGWMRDNAATYNIDPDHIAIGGASAGAVNSLAHAYNNPSPHEAAQAVLSYVGALAGAESLVEAGEVPAFVVNSDDDPLIPLSVPQAMVDQMNAVGVYNEFYVQTTGVGHDVDFSLVFDGKTLLERNIDFLAQFLVPEPSSFVLTVLAMVAFLAVARRKMRGLSA